MSWNFISLLSILLNLCCIIYASSPAAEVEIELEWSRTTYYVNPETLHEQSVPSSLTFHIEGKITPPETKPKDWYWTTRILLDGGKRLAYLKEDNSFSISGLSSGSYLLEVHNPDYLFEPVRMDINSKGYVSFKKISSEIN